MTRSIFDHLDNSPAPSPTSWPARKPPSIAYDNACAAIEARAARIATHMTKESALRFARWPRDLETIADGLSKLSLNDLIRTLRLLNGLSRMSPKRWIGFGGEAQVINLRGASLYARYLRAEAHKRKRRAA